MIIRRDKALKNVLEKMTINIDDNELIVGNQAGKLRAAPIFQEYTVDWIIKEIDELAWRRAVTIRRSCFGTSKPPS
jgi:formate C-acetyltransferase